MTPQQFCRRYSVDRKGTSSLKWDALQERFGDADLAAMWVADMEFQAPPQVLDALVERVRHGVFGYTFTPDSYYEALGEWFCSRHGVRVQREWIRFAPGVVTSLYWLVNAFTRPQDAVAIFTPVYYPFRNAVKDTGRRLVTCDLINQDGVYTMDLERFEREIVEQKVTLLIQCSPHNPVGRVWREEELCALLELCRRHGVLVISDEIHQDIIPGERRQISALSAGEGGFRENLAVVSAPSKTFNLAGLLHSQIFIPDGALRKRYDAYAGTICPAGGDILGMTAAQAAYRHGGEWLEDLVEVIRNNRDIIAGALKRKVPGAVVSPLEGTYLLWVDLRACVPPNKVKELVQDRCRLAVDYGEWFGDAGRGFIRLNLATDIRYAQYAADQLVEHLSR